MIDADVIVFATEKPADVAALKKVPTFDRLAAVSEGRSVYTDGTLGRRHVLRHSASRATCSTGSRRSWRRLSPGTRRRR